MSTQKARQLRRNSTDAERKLWRVLRNRNFMGYKFRRQQLLGDYIVDFVCLENRLIVEIDGGHHAEQVVQDTERQVWLESQGYQVIRFWNNQVLMETDSVREAILMALENSPSP